MRKLVNRWTFLAAVVGLLTVFAVRQEAARRRRQLGQRAETRQPEGPQAVREPSTIEAPVIAASALPFETEPTRTLEIAQAPAPAEQRNRRRFPLSIAVAVIAAVALPAIVTVVDGSPTTRAVEPSLAAMVVEGEDGNPYLLVRGERFAPGAPVDLYWDAPTEQTITAMASGEGLVLAALALPQHSAGHGGTAPTGEVMGHTLVASDGSMQAMLPVEVTNDATTEVASVVVAPVSSATEAAGAAPAAAAANPQTVPSQAQAAGEPQPIGPVQLAAVSHEFCEAATPLGALPPGTPEWCFLPQNPAVTTHVNGANSWLDDWQHGITHAQLGLTTDGYVGGTMNEGSCEALHWRHNNHWMADIHAHNGQWPTLCASWLRPNRTFRLENGRLVIEGEVAVPIAGTRATDQIDDSWPEFTISTAPRPSTAQENHWSSPLRPNGTYLYEAFPRAWTFGCRMQQSRHPICALYNAGEQYAGSTDRQWEINQNGGDVRYEYGGDPASLSAAEAAAWKTCTNVQDPDTVCRNKFRLEFYKDSSNIWAFDVYSNGVLYYRAGLEDNQMDNIFNAPNGFYIYFGAFAYRISSDTVLRFHWDHLAVNPAGSVTPPSPSPSPATATPPSASPTNPPDATPTNPPNATSTNVPPTATKTPTVVANPTPTPSGQLVNFGRTSSWGVNDTSDNGHLNGSRFTLSTGGKLKSLSVFVGATDPNGKIRLAIYGTNSRGGPGTLLAQTVEGTAAVGWNTLSIANGPTLTPGRYWILAQTNSTSTVYRMADVPSWPSSNQRAWAGLPYGAFPSNAPTKWSVDASSLFSMYGTVEN